MTAHIGKRQPVAVEPTCIADFIGNDGIEAFIERALELGEYLAEEADAQEVEAFVALFKGSYQCGDGRQKDAGLRQIHIPSGFVNVHVHDSVTGEMILGIYENRLNTVRAHSVAAAISMHRPVSDGACVVDAEWRQSLIPGVLRIDISLGQSSACSAPATAAFSS